MKTFKSFLIESDVKILASLGSEKRLSIKDLDQDSKDYLQSKYAIYEIDNVIKNDYSFPEHNSKRSRYFAIQDGVVIGAVNFELGKNDATIHHLGTTVKGVGKILLARVETDVKAAKLKKITLFTYGGKEDNFYQKHGYKKIEDDANRFEKELT